MPAAAGAPTTVRGAEQVAQRAQVFAANARFAEPVSIGGAVGVLVAPAGHLKLVLQFRVAQNAITAIDIIAETHRLAGLELALLDPEG